MAARSRSCGPSAPRPAELPIGAFARPRTDAPATAATTPSPATCWTPRSATARRRGRTRRTSAVESPGEPAAEPTPRTVRSLRLGVSRTGKIGSALTRAALRRSDRGRRGRALAGHRARREAAGARHVGPDVLASSCNVVAITVPLHVALALEPAAFQGAVVIDATNPWGEADAAAVAAARAELGDLDGRLSTERAARGRPVGGACGEDPEPHRLSRRRGPRPRGRRPTAPGDRGGGRRSARRRRRGPAAAADRLRGPCRSGRPRRGSRAQAGAGLFSGWSTRDELSRLRRELVRVA